MIATLNFPTLLKFPLGGAQQELERVSRMFSGAFRKPFQSAFATGDVVAQANWWEAGGATGAIQVLQPKGAASYAASLLDLSGSGNNATTGAAPSFNTATGWTFDGTQWVNTGIMPKSNYSWFVRYANWINGGTFTYLCGAQGSGVPSLQQFAIRLGSVTFGIPAVYLQVTASNGGTPPTAGVIALVGTQGYINGVADGSPVTATPDLDATLGIGGIHLHSGANFQPIKADVLASVFFDNTLDAGEITAIVAAMAAL